MRLHAMTPWQWNSLVQRLRQNAEAGDSNAQWELGSWLEEGLVDRRGTVVIAPDRRAAIRWYRRSAELGNPAGQNNLGVCLSDAKGAERNDAEALKWFKRALRQGESCAANNIACIYRDRGDHRRALQWYKKAVGSGDADALVEVGIRYYTGQGVRRDSVYAVQCFRKAIRSKRQNISEAGREKAMFRLGLAYFEGCGVKQSYRKALEWLLKANTGDDFPDARVAIKMIRSGADQKSSGARPSKSKHSGR